MQTNLKELKIAMVAHFLYGAQEHAHGISLIKPIDITHLSCSMTNYGILLGHIKGAKSIYGLERAMLLAGYSQEEAEVLIRSLK